MRIWSLHPKYLDAKGLVALWREALLAKNVLEGKTIGYKNHPQLNRFKQAKKPNEAINQYLTEIYLESVNRNYNFDIRKINWHFKKSKLTVTTGQLKYEVKHLLVKLKNRDVNKYEELSAKSTFEIHPLFNLIDGDIEKWELSAFFAPTPKYSYLPDRNSILQNNQTPQLWQVDNSILNRENG